MATQLRPLSEDRFLETFSAPMQDITKFAEEIVDIWEYTEAVLSSEFAGRDTQDWNVAYVYRNSLKCVAARSYRRRRARRLRGHHH